ncbi:MAG TPA: MBL fold metallo-hydrolase [Anaerolineae bacterium]|jgi:L-ascorbate metabolism protein UlaG (beta-lactamase superfamily)|nr:MBL fold metallo-hydrolase [Anaerolineae bacterium]
MSDDAKITYVGHATLLIEMDGVRLLTDPLLRQYIGHLRRRFPLPNDGLGSVDAVLISHLHGDHLDLPSLKRVGRDVRMIIPKGAGPYLKVRRFRRVEEIETGESIVVGGLRIEATRADHDGRQLPWVPWVEPLGYLIDGSHEIYFAGDTDLFPEMADIGQKLDLALVPVWGWGPNLGKGHLDPFRAARALEHLRPKAAIPIHWGTYSPVGLDLLRPKFLTRPPLDFAEHAAQLSPPVAVHVLQPGQSISLREMVPGV